ncbi:MAG: hypothetical protein LBD89_09090 [Tannerellaceae bacterium]|jgi:hypothetical protein|nr:hypothetical protein [Tannerellaceae bacterium]
MLQEMIIRIRANEWLSDALKLQGYDALPSNCIVHKSLPGTGITHCELEADRDSILVEPNVAVIKGKMQKHRNLLGFYEGIPPQAIADYLQRSSGARKKILITPDAFFTVKEIMKELSINMYEEFFLFLDECEKNFAIEKLRLDFFRFRHRAFVTAAPIIASDPLMRENGFFILQIRPDYTYRKNLHLITTNNIAETLAAQIAPMKAPVYIFCRSAGTIRSLMNDMPALREKARVFYREEAFDPDAPQACYNLLTEDYFLAVDISPEESPHVILISDLFTDQPSLIDPKTEVMQITGRFRKGIKSIVHISNIDPELPFYTPKQARNWLKNAGKIYASWRKKKGNTHYEGARVLLDEALRQSTFARFVDENGNIIPICVTKFIDEETVKSFYTNVKHLYEAYMGTKRFNLTHTREVHLFSDKDRLLLSRKLTQEGRNRLLLTHFEQLEVLRKVRSGKAQTRYLHLVDRLIEKPSDRFLYDCFINYGGHFIRNSGYKEEVMRMEIDRMLIPG